MSEQATANDTQSAPEPTLTPPPGQHPPQQQPAQSGPEPEQGSERPSWSQDVPEKFVADTPEETLSKVAAAYRGLEQKMGERSAQQDQMDSKQVSSAIRNMNQLLADIGVSSDDITNQWRENGSLSDDVYQKFEHNKGLSREMVDQFLAGQQALGLLQQQQRQKAMEAVYDIAGGQEQATNVLEWARDNLPEDYRWIHQQMTSPNATEAAARRAMEYATYKYAQANGQPGQNVEGQRSPSSQADKLVVRNSSDIQRLCNDERWAPKTPNGGDNPKHDPKYFQAVQAAITEYNSKRGQL